MRVIITASMGPAWNRRDDYKVVKFFDQERGPSNLWSWHTRGILISIPNTSLQLFLEGEGGSYFQKDGFSFGLCELIACF